jgi:putative chitinase
VISFDTLVAAGIGPTQARQFAAPLQQACDLYDLNTAQRQAAFVAQCAHESSLLIHLEEDLFYRDPTRLMKIFPREIPSLGVANTLVGNRQGLANTVYANRLGNGPYSTGDGFKFHGRGLIQLTGRANYAAAALDLGEPYVEKPELVAEPSDACLTAVWFWARNRCNDLADASDIDGITKIVNGPGMEGAQERRDLYRRALQAFR